MAFELQSALRGRLQRQNLPDTQIRNIGESPKLDAVGNPMTDAARITERFRRIDFGHMEIEVTVDDPKAYTKPWTIKMIHNIVLNTELIDYICAENEKDLGHLIGK